MGNLMTWPKAPESISAEGTKTYYVGDRLDLSDLVVTMTMADGTSRILRRDEFNVSPRVFTEANQDVVVEYCWDTADDPLTATATGITVGAKAVSSISIKYLPNKTEYELNEPFDATGVGITAFYSNGTSATIGEGFTVSEPDTSTAGIKEVTVTYEGNTDTFDITVKDIVAAALVIDTTPTKLTYTWGETADATGLQATAWFSDGHSEDVTSDCIVGFNNGSIAGESTTSLIISYDTLEQAIPVTTVPAGIIAVPELNIDEDTLTISTEDSNTEEYALYVDGDLVDTIPVA